MLVEFASEVDAVRCAIEVQGGMNERNEGLPPERRIEFRLGIHVGDVMAEADGDLMGDGVNIAARLERIALPGGTCLSEDARGKVGADFADLGERSLKKIAQPVRVYAIAPATPRAAERSAPRRLCTVRQYRWRPGATIFRRRRHRKPDHRSLSHRRGVRRRRARRTHGARKVFLCGPIRYLLSSSNQTLRPTAAADPFPDIRSRPSTARPTRGRDRRDRQLGMT
jgi:hypothetical protein